MSLYPISSLFFYRIIFMCWLLFGEGMFLFRLEKKDHYPLRLAISYIVCLAFSVAFPIPTGNAFYLMFMFFVFFILTFFMALFRYKGNWRIIFFSVICGYTVEHIAYETYFAIANFSGILGYGTSGLYSNETISLFTSGLDQLVYFVSYFVVYWLGFICFANRLKNLNSLDVENNVSALLLGAFFVIIDIVINSAVSFYGTIHYENNFMGFVAIINVLCCIVALLFIFEISYKSALRKDLEIVNEIRKEEKNQYEISKETIDLINVKCHDLKHQIRTIGDSEQLKPETVESLSNLIQIYDSSIKTQNSVLDIILTEKSLYCNKREIKFSCIADGSKLDFMSEEDTYSFFGNVLDNAIKAVENLDKDKRTITLKIVPRGNMLSISVKNAYAGHLEFTGDGLPKTSKKDSNYHGFGLRSVKMICDKYHGSMSIDDKNNIFTFSALFFISEHSEAK